MKYPIYGVWGICTLLILCLACQNEEPSAQHSTPPNILFITVDDLRPQLGAYGHEYMVTPHMDRLAKNGRLFANHYVIVPTCGPSRYTMLTGQYPVTRAELRNDIFEKTTAMNHRSDKPESMIEAFRRNGYYTVGIGKISHSPDGLVYGYTDSISDVRELPQSWDEFHFNHGKWGTGWNAFFGYADGGNRQSLDSEVKPYESAQVDDNGYPDGLTAQLAISQLNDLKNNDKPFFLAVGFFKPHLPFNAPQKYWDLYQAENLPLPEAPLPPTNTHRSSFHESGEFNRYQKGKEKANLNRDLSPSYARKLRHAYFASVSYVDAQIGKVLDALEKNDLAENTIVVVWGDHGWHLGDHRIWGKHTLSEYSMRSTLIIKSPEMTSPGTPSKAIIESTDIYPTLLDLANLEISGELVGKSFKKILEDPHASSDGLAYGYFRQGITLRTPRYRITRYFRPEQPRVELYDYVTDPFETENVAALHPQIVDSLMNLWLKGNTGLYGSLEEWGD